MIEADEAAAAAVVVVVEATAEIAVVENAVVVAVVVAQQVVAIVDVAAFCPSCDMLPAYDEGRDTRYFSVGLESKSDVGIWNRPNHSPVLATKF